MKMRLPPASQIPSLPWLCSTVRFMVQPCEGAERGPVRTHCAAPARQEGGRRSKQRHQDGGTAPTEGASHKNRRRMSTERATQPAGAACNWIQTSAGAN